MEVLSLPLTLTVTCRGSDRASAVRHPVVIGADWSFETGHDEGLEAIAAALGGGVSCVAMLRGIAPGLLTWWWRARREGGFPIRSSDRGQTWHSAEGPWPCCPARGFVDPREAGAHVRDARHVAALTGTPARDLARVVASVMREQPSQPPAWGGLGDTAPDPVLADAWACGLSPEWVVQVHRQLAADHVDGVDLRVLLAIAQTGADPRWIAQTSTVIHGRPESWHASADRASTPEWLAWTYSKADSSDPAARARWLWSGARRADIEVLSGAGLLPVVAEEVAADWGISVPGAAQLLARWVAAGYLPTPEQLGSVRAAGLTFPPHPPSPAAVKRVEAALRAGDRGNRRSRGRRDHDQTELAVGLATWGTVHDTAAALRREEEQSVRT